MKFGLGFFPTAEAIPPGELGRMVEERGHESLFFAEGTHISAARRSEYPVEGELPPKYARTWSRSVCPHGRLAAPHTPAPRAGTRTGTRPLCRLHRSRSGGRPGAVPARAPADPAKLEALAELGVSRVAHWLPSGKRSAVEPALERWEAAIGKLYGEA